MFIFSLSKFLQRNEKLTCMWTCCREKVLGINNMMTVFWWIRKIDVIDITYLGTFCVVTLNNGIFIKNITLIYQGYVSVCPTVQLVVPFRQLPTTRPAAAYTSRWSSLQRRKNLSLVVFARNLQPINSARCDYSNTLQINRMTSQFSSTVSRCV